jgi:hypothetical protein
MALLDDALQSTSRLMTRAGGERTMAARTRSRSDGPQLSLDAFCFTTLADT